MEPRSKKGPSWKDDAIAQQSSSSFHPDRKKNSKAGDASNRLQPDSVDGEAPQEEAVSDMDWLKRHTKASVNVTEPSQETVFDQSADDIEHTSEEAAKEVSSLHLEKQLL